MKSPEYGGTFWAQIGDFFATVRAGYLRWLTPTEKELEEAIVTGVPNDGTPNQIKELVEVVNLSVKYLKKVPSPDPERKKAAREGFLLNAAEKLRETNRCRPRKKVA